MSSWWVAILTAVVASVVLAYGETLGGNYGGVVATLQFLASVMCFLLPIMTFWLLQLIYLREPDLKESRVPRRAFIAGVVVWASLIGVLISLAQQALRSSFALHVAWPFASMCLFILPLGARLLAEIGVWKKQYSVAACIAATTIGAVLLAAGLFAPEEILMNAGPLPAFVFSNGLLLLYLANLNPIPTWVWLAAHGVLLIAAADLSYFIFFQGVFYGGGMAPLLLFSLTVLGGAVVQTYRRGLGQAPDGAATK